MRFLKTLSLLAVAPLAWVIVGCPADPVMPDAGGDAGPVCVPDRAMWDAQISTNVTRYCGSCHGETPNFGAPFSLTSYDDIVAHAPGRLTIAALMAGNIRTGVMPPSFLSRMPDATANSIVEWASCGAQHVTEQRGIQSSAAPWLAPDESPAGFETLDLTAQEFPVRTTDRDRYRCFIFDVPVTEDRFVKRFEMVFDRTEVLHHLVLLRDSDRSAPADDYDCIGSMPTGSQYLYAWAPGQGAVEFPEGGLRVRPGERYVMQIHYNNAAEIAGIQDSSGVRLTLGPTTGPEYGMLAIGPLAYELPPRQTTRVSSYCTVREESQMIAGMPHMHTLGTEFHERVERATTMRMQNIVDVTGWEFDAQLFYALPVTLNVGDRIFTECVYENMRSETVSTGARTEDEMCFNFAYITPPPSERYCDEMGGPPTDLPYAPGMCAPGADRDVPLANLPWEAGTPAPLAGGTVPDARWLFTGGRYVVDSTSTPIGEIDLTRTFTIGRGQVVTNAGAFTLDIATHIFLQSAEGPSFSVPNTQTMRGTWTPGTSPAPFMQSCPETGSDNLNYERVGNTLRIRFGPISDALPGRLLWVEFDFTQAS